MMPVSCSSTSGSGVREAVGAAELPAASTFAAAPTASTPCLRHGGNVVVATLPTRAAFATTTTLQGTVMETWSTRGADVGVPEVALASRSA